MCFQVIAQLDKDGHSFSSSPPLCTAISAPHKTHQWLFSLLLSSSPALVIHPLYCTPPPLLLLEKCPLLPPLPYIYEQSVPISYPPFPPIDDDRRRKWQKIYSTYLWGEIGHGSFYPPTPPCYFPLCVRTRQISHTKHRFPTTLKNLFSNTWCWKPLR